MERCRCKSFVCLQAVLHCLEREVTNAGARVSQVLEEGCTQLVVVRLVLVLRSGLSNESAMYGLSCKRVDAAGLRGNAVLCLV